MEGKVFEISGFFELESEMENDKILDLLIDFAEQHSGYFTECVKPLDEGYLDSLESTVDKLPVASNCVQCCKETNYYDTLSKVFLCSEICSNKYHGEVFGI